MNVFDLSVERDRLAEKVGQLWEMIEERDERIRELKMRVNAAEATMKAMDELKALLKAET